MDNKTKLRRIRKDGIIGLIFLIITIAGLVCLLYPTASDVVNTVNETKAIRSYQKEVNILPVDKYRKEYSKAVEYNEKLYELDSPLLQYDKVIGYESTLNVNRNGIIGIIDIPKIDIYLPIYHGTEDDVLKNGIGHLQGSSLPTDGENVHAIIAAHRGVMSARLFTDIDELELGDEFSITVLNQVLTYQVDNIQVVLPEEVSELEIIEGGNYVTLQTCTPYGINTHRLLVRGKLLKTDELEDIRSQNGTFEETIVTVISVLMNKRNITPVIIAACMVFVFVGIRVIINVRRSRKTASEIENEVKTEDE